MTASHKLIRRVLIPTLLLLALPSTTPEVKAGYGRMPYYSAWASKGDYRYRTYNYYSPAYATYRSHVAVYYPNRPRYVYYYNPYKRRYWGRYDIATGGYSTLAVQDRKETLAEIPDGAFPNPGPMPTPEDGEDPLLPPVEKLPPTQTRSNPGLGQRPTVSYPINTGSTCHGY